MHDRLFDGRAHHRYVPNPSSLIGIQQLYDAGNYRDAWVLMDALAPLREWDGAEGALLAGRMAGNLGAPRLGASLVRRSYRCDQNSGKLQTFRAYHVLDRLGPFWFWRFHLNRPVPRVEDHHYAALLARVHAYWRDVETAERMIGNILDEHPKDPWVWVEAAYIHRASDRFVSALEAVEHALTLRAHYRPGVQLRAELMLDLGRMDEALKGLLEAATSLQSGSVAMQIAAIYSEMEDARGIEQWIDQAVHDMPLAEPELKRFFLGRRLHVGLLRGDVVGVAETMRSDGAQEWQSALARIDAAAAHGYRRKKLAVYHVAQKHNTCAPATLAAVMDFWGAVHSQDEIVNAICYDGTHSHAERNWVERQGWLAREFRPDWETVVRLIDAGIPLVLQTVAPTHGHLQAIIGYESVSRKLLIRDPGSWHYREVVMDDLLADQQAFGPRAMVVLPPTEVGRLEGVSLPESSAYDLLHQLQTALTRHARDEAVGCLVKLETEHTDSFLVIHARRILAVYDGNQEKELRQVHLLLRKYPNDARIAMNYLRIKRDLGHKNEIRPFLENIVREGKPHPQFLKEMGSELLADAGQRDIARRLLMRASIRLRTDPALAADLAFWDWREGRKMDSLQGYRFAACYADKNEYAARQYFQAARALGRGEEALQFLRKRVERFGHADSGPSRTLAALLDSISEEEEADRVLNEALELHQNDGELLLHAADSALRRGRVAQAKIRLEQALERTSTVSWIRTSVRLETYLGRIDAVRLLWEQLLELDPLAVDAHRGVALWYEHHHGLAAACDYLDGVVRNQCHHFSLGVLALEWARRRGALFAIPHCARLIELDPQNAWAHREMALILIEAGKGASAVVHAEEAVKLQPDAAASHYVLGETLAAGGRTEGLQEYYRKALECSIDHNWSIQKLVQYAVAREGKRSALAWIMDQIRLQTVSGPALYAYRQAAFPILDEAELENELREIHRHRPDLWDAWCVLVRQLADIGKREEAHELLARMVEEFPLTPGTWREQASVLILEGRNAEAAESLRRVLELNPDWTQAVLDLAQALERDGRTEEALFLLERQRQRAPREDVVCGSLAQLYWRQGRSEDAGRLLAGTLRDNPAYVWGWNALRHWRGYAPSLPAAAELASRLVAENPQSPAAWLALCNQLDEDGARSEALQAVKKALDLHPHHEDLRDRYALCQWQLGQTDRALETCRSGIPSRQLQWRGAWILVREKRIKEALEWLGELVQNDPGYYQAWSLKADIAMEQAQWGEADKSVREMMRLAPNQAIPLGYLGDLHFSCGRYREAAEAFERALILDPDYLFAGKKYFEIGYTHISDEGRRTVLNLLSRGRGRAIAKGQEIRKAIRDKDPKSGMEALRQFLLLPSWEGEDAQELIKLARAAGSQWKLGKMWNELLMRLDLPTHTARLWLTDALHREHFHFGILRRLRFWAKSGYPYEDLLRQYVEFLGERASVELWLAWLVWREKNWFSQNDSVWGSVGYALAKKGWIRWCARWLSDWKTRRNLRPWMLRNLLMTQEYYNSQSHLEEVALAGAELDPPDHTSPIHHLTLAVVSALRSDQSAARLSFSRLIRQDLPKAEHLKFGLVEGWLAFQGANPESRAEEFHRIKAELDALERIKSANRFERFAYTRLMREMAAQSGIRPVWWKARYPWHTMMQGWFSEFPFVAVLVMVPLFLLAPPLSLGLLIYLLMNKNQKR